MTEPHTLKKFLDELNPEESLLVKDYIENQDFQVLSDSFDMLIDRKNNDGTED